MTKVAKTKKCGFNHVVQHGAVECLCGQVKVSLVPEFLGIPTTDWESIWENHRHARDAAGDATTAIPDRGTPDSVVDCWSVMDAQQHRVEILEAALRVAKVALTHIVEEAPPEIARAVASGALAALLSPTQEIVSGDSEEKR